MRTIQEIMDRAICVLGGVDLYCTPQDHGLTVPWHGRLYVQPPYGQGISRWVDRLVTDYQAGQVTAAIVLIPARTDTRWWRRLNDFPRCFITGRLRFSGQKSGAPFPSAVVALGCDLQAFVTTFGDVGDIWQRWTPPPAEP